MQSYFPFFVNIDQKKILVYGAGKIAGRRIAGILRFGASVVVKAPQIQKGIWELQKNYAHRLFIEQRPYQYDEIQKKDADLVLAATDDKQINERISIECRRKGIPVNNASDSSQCDFYFPAFVERDGLLIAVISTDGNHKKVAEFSAKLRMEDDMGK